MPVSRAASGSAKDTGLPSSTSRPASASTTPAMILHNVLLPQPFDPSKACTSPRSSANRAPSRATTPPKRLCTPSASSRGMGRGPDRPRLLLEPVRLGLFRRHHGGDRVVARFVLHLVVDLREVGAVDQGDRDVDRVTVLPLEDAVLELPALQ